MGLGYILFVVLFISCHFVTSLPREFQWEHIHEPPVEENMMERVRINAKGQFVDVEGRVRLFRGINSVKKGFPWHKQGILNDTRLRYYRDWGFNALRLGTMWSGVYPKAGQVNDTYVNILQEIVRKAGSYGIYSLLDMHQDVFSSRFAMYDGIPLWLVDSFPRVPEELRFPWPQKNRTDWYFQGYFTYECEAAFQNLYDNKSNAWGHWGQFWTTMTKTFKGNTNVMGYELINEPFAGNGFVNPKRFMPGYAGRNNLLPVYDYLVDTIRRLDNDTLIFFEPVTWATLFPGSDDMGTGFDRVPGSAPEEHTRSVFSYHYYCWILQVTNVYNIPYEDWKRIVCDDGFATRAFQNMLVAQKQLKMGLFLTEFGSCSPDGNSTTINTIECDFMLHMADKLFQSWMYWDSHFFRRGVGDIDWNLVRYFSRTYPTATAGEPLDMYFDPVHGDFNYTFALNASIHAPTEIFLPLSVHYGNNVTNLDIQVTPTTSMQYQLLPETQRLLVYAKTDDFHSYLSKDGQIVTVKISKKIK